MRSVAPSYAAPEPTVSKHAIAADGDDVAFVAEPPVPCTAGIVGPMCVGAVVIDDGRIEFPAEEPGDTRSRCPRPSGSTGAW
jgi:hypothetical protein